MPSTQDLRRKIGSVKATGKLTRAMQMVAASKMSKATAAALASRAYAREAWAILGNLSGRTPDVSHALFAASDQSHRAAPKPGGRRAVIAITSNRGLAGSLNSALVRLVSQQLDERTDLIVAGRKGVSYFRRFHPDNLKADFPASDSTPRALDAEPIAKLVTNAFQAGEYGRVDVAYTHFVSTLTAQPRLAQLLPIVPAFGDSSEVNSPSSSEVSPKAEEREKNTLPQMELAPPKPQGGEVGELLVEPDPATVLNLLAARIVPLRLYQMLLESSASEHSARMVAMKSATDNAKDIVADLTLTYQSIRQANITREIIEVSAGANALQA